MLLDEVSSFFEHSRPQVPEQHVVLFLDYFHLLAQIVFIAGVDGGLAERD